jgi:hypothetical protein
MPGATNPGWQKSPPPSGGVLVNLPADLAEPGYLVLDRVLHAETVDRLIAFFERLHPGHALRGLLDRFDSIRELASSDNVVDRVRAVLGPGAFPVRGTYFDKTPQSNWKVGWHQDLTIEAKTRIDTPGYGPWSTKEGAICVQPPAMILERMLTIRIHLDDCNSDNGALVVLPGSHREGVLDRGGIDAWKQHVTPVVCNVPRGGALLMRPLLLHASSEATNPAHRRVIHLDYAADPLDFGLEWRSR